MLNVRTKYGELIEVLQELVFLISMFEHSFTTISSLKILTASERFLGIVLRSIFHITSHFDQAYSRHTDRTGVAHAQKGLNGLCLMPYGPLKCVFPYRNQGNGSVDDQSGSCWLIFIYIWFIVHVSFSFDFKY